MKDAPQILGYGEDALTLWALKRQLPEIMRQLKDHTSPSKCTVFFRPSFGRAGGKGSAEFGEFDAIIASTECVYLVESKWDNFGRSHSKKVSLRKPQTLRHDILSWYIIHWETKYSGRWKDFRTAYDHDLKKKGKKTPREGSLLAENLEHVLQAIHPSQRPRSSIAVKNVLLFLSMKRGRPIKTERSFHVVNVPYGRSLKFHFMAMT